MKNFFNKTALFFVLISPLAHGQVFNGVVDGVYVRENEKVYIKNKDYIPLYKTSYIWPVVGDSMASIALKQFAVSRKNLYQENKLPNDDLILFNANPLSYFDSSGKFNGGFPSQKNQKDKSLPGNSSIRFHTDSLHTALDKYGSLKMYSNATGNEYLSPFYLKKFEVTNSEYKAFIEYVKDSLARILLVGAGFDEYLLKDGTGLNDSLKLNPYGVLNKKTKIDWSTDKKEIRDALQPLYLPVYERFYNREEIDTRKLNYLFYYVENGIKKKEIINVYPDSLSWTHDFPYVYNEPMTNMYTWHPAYNDYPVVGVSWYQARAFLNWKTVEENKKLKAAGKQYRVKFDLPSETEWEMAAAALPVKGKPELVGSVNNFLYDKSWMFDLYLEAADLLTDLKTNRTIDSTAKGSDYVVGHAADTVYVCSNVTRTTREEYIFKDNQYYLVKREEISGKCLSPLYESQNLDERFQGNFVMDGFFHTAPAALDRVSKSVKYGYWDGSKFKFIETKTNLLAKNLDVFGISFMGGNVSEWLREDYKDFNAAMQWRLKYLKNINTTEARLEMEMEKFHYESCFPGGKLVRGGNWFDERFSEKLGKNYSGMTLKRFADPSRGFCTVGFRYVVHVLPAQ